MPVHCSQRPAPLKKGAGRSAIRAMRRHPVSKMWVLINTVTHRAGKRESLLAFLVLVVKKKLHKLLVNRHQLLLIVYRGEQLLAVFIDDL